MTDTAPVRVLLSYHYFQKVDIDDIRRKLTLRGVAPDLFADSGGFSAFQAGMTIDVHNYARWLHRWQDHFTVAANLDVIGDHAASMRNLDVLEAEGLNPIPVFHTYTEDTKILEGLCERYDYVAIGGMVGFRAADIFPWMVKCHKVARKHNTMLHGFGQTAWRPLIDLPWYSVDSSTWGMGFRFGTVPLFDDAKGKLVKIRLGDQPGWSRHARLVRSYGFEPAEFYDRDRNRREYNCGIAMEGYRRLEAWLRRRHGLVEHPGDGAPGINVYLADTTIKDAVSAVVEINRRNLP